MKQLLDVKTTSIGSLEETFLAENTLIIFNEDIPAELHNIAVLHTKCELADPVQVGDSLMLADVEYMITAVGINANDTLASMGHCTIKFDGALIPELPGTIHAEKKDISVPDVDMVLQFIRK
ncbi:PTS glucitol/sorbitol transporter subunit IIA [Brevibacillus daliensis]|uniref:PTS glucitol/sorbitol transporter subunit IIA n=1 Tax=Brevibacillus daliensis TaxID=2892995 RepID=UPI001E35ACB7|nr:PTS glucitol/sorbitol transporter subunit IIA [Brevibacillus daliensis]